MPSGEPLKLSPFGDAAVALAQELERFRRLAEEGQRVPIDSRRNLERAARLTEEATASQQRLGDLMQRFIGALNAAREDNDRWAAALIERRAELEKRTNEVGELLSRYARLGTIASDISTFVRTVGEQAKAGGATAETFAGLAEVEAQMSTVVEEARALMQAARAANVAELVTESDTLRQQLDAARNKTALLRQRLAPGGKMPTG